ncbi:hypothetical protein GDO86_009355 [Hymenochirus boettgeri]|uniref:Nesprin-1 n=1 Tax=Hymenochirus boettgeri TaxID=247094 RepID=A0A8T2JG45_9PIPI|nr:hypothetical protein GDO86_009355 [Hymenochirus boettgeri]
MGLELKGQLYSTSLCSSSLDVLKNIDGYKKAFQEIHRSRSVNGVPVPIEQLEDMAERFSYVASSSQLHMIKLEFMELKYRLLALLVLAESKLKSWIIKYGRRESVELLLQNYIAFIDGNRFFEQYEFTSQTLKQAAEIYVNAEGSADEAENVTKFLNETTVQWRNLSVEVRSVRSMLEEVISNWDKYSNTVASLQAWLEDAEKMLDLPEHAKKDFFRHLPHLIQQHTTMNDAGNFLIETCDETVSKDIKQQLLLLNGRWRELFMEVKHYAREDEYERAKKEYADGLIALAAFAEGGNERISTPLEVSFLNVKMFVQDLEDIKLKMPIIEAQYKSVTRKAQLLTKESHHEEANEMLSAVTRIKDQLNKIREHYPPLLYESQQLLTPLGEFESHMTNFYEHLEKIHGIISAAEIDMQTASVFKHKQRELLSCQESCKNTLLNIEKYSHAIHKALTMSKSLHHFDRSILQKKLTDAQAAFQNVIKRITEWRKKVDVNDMMMKKFEESKTELEKALKTAETYFKETGNPSELLKRHTEFFGQLDQKVLNTFLKACDELTDILPEQDQQTLQETVRKLHKQWKDFQSEAPYHLLHLKIELEKNKILTTIEECKVELARENKMLPVEGSEKIIKEHRTFFSERGFYHVCKKRLHLIEELCLKLQEQDPVKDVLETSKSAIQDVKAQIDSTHLKLMEHPDKWKDYRIRLSDLSGWLVEKDEQLRQIKGGVNDSTKYETFKRLLADFKIDVTNQEDNLKYLKERLIVLTDVSVEVEVAKQNNELARVSTDFQRFLELLSETEQLLSSVRACIQCSEEVQNILSQLITSTKDAEREAEKILDTESFAEAQELLLNYQQNIKSIRSKKEEVQQHIAQAKNLQEQKGLFGLTQQHLTKMETELDDVEKIMVKQEETVQVTMNIWEQIETGKESIKLYLKQIGPTLERSLSFCTLDGLSSELQQAKELCKQNEDTLAQAENIMKKSIEIQLGAKSKQSLHQQTKSIQEKVERVKDSISKNITEIESIKEKWEKFNLGFETHSAWISEKEKELQALESSHLPPQMQITQIQKIIKQLNSQSQEIGELETKCQSFAQFIASAEMARIRARMSQISKNWLGLMDQAQRLEESILGNAEQQRKFDENLKEDLCYEIDSLKNSILALTTYARKLSNKDKAMLETMQLQQQHDTVSAQAKVRHALLEQLLAQWQRQERDYASFTAWMEKTENLVSPKDSHFPADKAKLEAEVQAIMDLQCEAKAQTQRYVGLVQTTESLYNTCPEKSKVEMKEHLGKLTEKWIALPKTILQRLKSVEFALGEHQKFDDMILEFSLWIKKLHKELHETAEITTSDYEAVLNINMKHLKEVKRQEKELQNLKVQLQNLCSFSNSEEHPMLQGRIGDCIQLYEEAVQIISRREDALSKLNEFLHMHKDSFVSLQHLKESVDSTTSLDKTKSESLAKELNNAVATVENLTSLSVVLDASLTKAQFYLKCASTNQRTSCRALAENLILQLDVVQTYFGTKKSEAEALSVLWKSFIDSRETLLKSIEDIEEKADKEEMKEPTLQALQQRLKFFNELEEEMISHNHEKQWLMDKAKQIAQKNLEMAAEADKLLNGFKMTWDDTYRVISENQEQCSELIDVTRDYQHLKSVITKCIENAENLVTIKSTLKDPEDIKRTISRHESAKNDLNENQKDLDEFTNKGKHMLVDLKKIHGCDLKQLKKDMEFFVDKWLDHYGRSLIFNDEIDGWSSSSISQMSENITNLNSSQQLRACLDDFQSEITNKGQKLEEFHSKVCELKELTKSQEPPAKLQMAEWLNKVEESVLKYASSEDPDDLNKLKDIQKEVQAQQSSLDTTQENLNSLCRKYRSAELEILGISMTSLIKKYEAVNQLCMRTQVSLQDTLEKCFYESMSKFEEWFEGVKKGVREYSDWSGDSRTLEGKIEHLQSVLNLVPEGESKLDAAIEEGEKLYFCVPKPIMVSIQEQIFKAQKEFQAFKKQCLKDKQALENCASELGSFEDQFKKLTLWIHELEERLRTEGLGESKQHIPEKKNEIQKVEMFLEELLASRDLFERLSQRAQALNEDGVGGGQEVRLSSQLLTNYQNLTKTIKEKLRACQVALQDHQIFEEALQTTWSWLKDMQDKLITTENTVGSKSALETRLIEVQDMLLVKGEGEVKLNLAIGKGEQAMKSSNRDGQMVIQMQLQTLKDVWGTVNNTATRCLSCLESILCQWNEYIERKGQLELWLESIDQKLEQPVQLQNGLKEKFALLEHIQAIVSDIEDHSTTLHHVSEKAKELQQRTKDEAFSDAVQNELKTHFNDILTVAKEKMRKVEDIVKDHLMYLDAVHEFTDWLTSAKEELHRWSDTSGDSKAIQKKLTKIKELIDSRQTGVERLNRIETIVPAIKQNTTISGCGQIDTEIQGLQADWKQWEESIFHSQRTLEGLLNQMAISEQEFTSQVLRLEEANNNFNLFLEKWTQKLMQGEGKNSDKEIVENWHQQKEILSALTDAEIVTDELKTQLNELCRFSKDLSVYSMKVSSLIKEYNSMFEFAYLFSLLQNMLLEIEQKVVALTELSVHSENLRMEGKAHTKEEAEQLASKLRTLKGSLLELQRVLQDKQISIQGNFHEKEETESELLSSQSPSVQEWLVQTRTTRSLQKQNSLQRQKELEQELAEQKKLLQSVATRGGEIINQQTTERSDLSENADSLSLELRLEGFKTQAESQMRMKWENLYQELITKEKLVQNVLEQEQEQLIFSKTNRIPPGVPFYKGEEKVQDKTSVTEILDGLNQALEDVSVKNLGAEKKILPFERKLYDAVFAASTWLDDVEEHIFVTTALQPQETEACLYQQETLAKYIKEMSEEMDKNKNLFFQTFSNTGDNQEIIEDTLYCLMGRLNSLESVVNHRCYQMKQRLQDLLSFQNDLKVLFTTLADSKLLILHKLSESAEKPAKEQIQAILQAEDSLKELDAEITDLKRSGDQLQVDQSAMQELSKLQDTYDELMRIIGSRRSGLNQNLALKGQYERALQDLSDLIETGTEKMQGRQTCLVSSRDEVEALLDKHKEYFQGLESHVILTETLFRKISTYTIPSESEHHLVLIAKASALLKQAHKRGVELEYILETWILLDVKYQELLKHLEAIENSIPTVGLVEETEERLQERIELFQCVKLSLVEHQTRLYEILEDGKKLLMSVTCPELEALMSHLGEKWWNNNNRVCKELQRLDNILKLWTRYKSESAELVNWLWSATDRLEFWTEQSLSVPQELETVRDHLNAFLEFSKEVDARSSLKSSVLSTGNQLLRLKKVDTASLRSDLTKIETQWTELLIHIPVVQEKLHQLQMDKLPSRHAIAELMTWISIMENVIKEDEEKIRTVLGCEDIQEYLLKYKGFKIDVNCKQLTVDFVNQSVLQISSQDVESKRSDKTDFAEKLGAMNRRWQILQGLITEKIQVLEGLLETWTEYGNSVQSLKSWFEKQQMKLHRQKSIGDTASVQKSLKECQELEDLIKAKEKELEKVEQRGVNLIKDKKEKVTATVLDTLRDLHRSCFNLEDKVRQQKTLLQSVLDQWTMYKKVYEELNSYLMEAKYSISHFRLLTGSMEAVKVQVSSLQSLQEELEKQGCSVDKFGSITNDLLNSCNSSVKESLQSTLNEISTRWNNLMEEISEQLHSSKSLLQLWQKYKDYRNQGNFAIQQQEERTNQMLKTASNKDIGDDEVSIWISDCNSLLKGLNATKVSLGVLSEIGDQLKEHVDTNATTAILSDHFSLNQRLSVLEQALLRQQAILQTGVIDYEAFMRKLEDLEAWIIEAEKILNGQDPNRSSDLSIIQDRMEELKRQMLKFSSLAPDLDRLNELGYRLPLNDKEIKRMQSLNRQWTVTSSQTTERFSKLQSFLLQHQTFLEKCETWMEFLIETEQKLAVEISGNYQNLLEQQRAHELFQAEMFSRQQILHSITVDGQRLLEQGQVEDRDEFNLKLTLLSNQWQGVIRRAQQRKGIIDSQIRQWQRYREMAEKLRKWLVEMSYQPVTGLGSSLIPLQQARNMLDEVQLKDKVLHRQQGSYILTVEAGKQLLLSVDSIAEAALQAEITDIQEKWKVTTIRLEQQKKHLALILKDWEKCEKGIAESLEKLRSFRKNLSPPLPDHHNELHTEQMHCKELENAVEGWVDALAYLTTLKENLTLCISVDDISILNERIELLQRQWEELCHQVSLRRQQVSERLNEWAIFNEKNKELCEWLTQMESKVSQNSDISIEEMIEKLQKDYQDEIAIAHENKVQLQKMGERLVRASHESKASEIDYKLSKVNDRWQHLLDLIEARVKKLKETLVAVQQLDKNMSSLRSWLGHIESELSKPIVYETSDSEEIQRKLNEQQELQRDIERHTTGVASVLSLCEVLLRDCDACTTDTECDSIQQATQSLERRWRNICAMSTERRLKIEETWRLWQKFLDDFSRFEDWLLFSERTAAYPSSSGVLYTVAKEELKKFEAFQRQVHESLTQLELINKQYRRLARENRTDSSCKLKEMVHEGNQRWDNLQKRVTSILRRLKHFIGQREEFETARESILVWLTEMDLQLTNIEHFSECDVQAKIKQLKAFQREISLNSCKIDQIIAHGEQLIEKCEPLDAAVIEEELDELQRYCLEVFGRVDRYHKKLIRLPLTDDEHDFSDREVDVDEMADLSDIQWQTKTTENIISPLPSSNHSLSLIVPMRSERSGRDTPASVDSIPLEWDHDYDLSRDLESALSQKLHSDGEEEQADKNYFLQGATGVTGESSSLESQIRQLDKALDTGRFHLQQTENVIRSRTPTGPELDSSYVGYMKLLSECRFSIDTVRRVSEKLKEEEENLSGFIHLNSTETQSSGVIERWELIHAQALNKELRMKQKLQQWQQFISDLNNIWDWLVDTEEELEHLHQLAVSTDIQAIEQRIKKLKDLQKAVDSRKAIVLSINLCSSEFTQPTTQESKELQERLSQMNLRWDRLCSTLDDWRSRLQDALMQCQDFHEMSHGLLLWLENIDRRRNEMLPINPNLDSETHQDHLKLLTQIRRELLESQLKVACLQDMSCQLLVNAEGKDCIEAKEKVHVIGNRLKVLLKEVTRHIRDIEKILDISSNQLELSSWSSADELDTSGSISPVSGRSTPSRQRTVQRRWLRFLPF